MNKASTVIAAGLVVMSTAGAIAHAERYVVVNGERLGESEIVQYEMQCGSIADGEYWVNRSTGTWGYAGNPIPRGIRANGCYILGFDHSLSRRGMLYGPGELMRDN